jgi:hypothetical protein
MDHFGLFKGTKITFFLFRGAILVHSLIALPDMFGHEFHLHTVLAIIEALSLCLFMPLPYLWFVQRIIKLHRKH